MTKDFDIVTEQKISLENLVESQFVNVGWGSFETQFKGSVGKNVVKEKVNKLKYFYLISKLNLKMILSRQRTERSDGTTKKQEYAGDQMANILLFILSIQTQKVENFKYLIEKVLCTLV